MKKGLTIFVLLIALAAGAAWYFLSGAGEFIRAQIEQQGSKFLSTSVSVSAVDLALADGRLTISGLAVKNPSGFSDNNAFSLNDITFDIGDVMSEPYVIQEVSINAPQVLYEVDENGKGNLLVLKDNLTKQLPQSTEPPADTKSDAANPLLMIENVTVSNVQLRINFEKLSTGDIQLEQKAYDVTLPTFKAGPIGKPNGIPADQAGAAIANEMLSNIIKQAKSEAKKRLEEAAKAKAKEKLDEKKDELLDKAKDKLKGIFN